MSSEKDKIKEFTKKQVLDFISELPSEDCIIVDVRADRKGQIIPKALHVPYDELSSSLQDLSKYKHVFFICTAGVRSISAAKMLIEFGHKNSYSITGGNNEWWNA